MIKIKKESEESVSDQLKKPNISAIFFDLDGTLIDSEPAAIRAIRAFLKEQSKDFVSTDVQAISGRSWPTTIQILKEKYQLSHPQNELLENILKLYRLELQKDLCPVLGSIQAIETLSKKYPLALVSGSVRKDILWALEKFKVRDQFQCILGAEDYTRGKPDPESYLKACQFFNILPQQALIFEDSDVGIQSGVCAGAWVVEVQTKKIENLTRTYQPHWTIPHFQEVNPQWVQTLALK